MFEVMLVAAIVFVAGAWGSRWTDSMDDTATGRISTDDQADTDAAVVHGTLQADTGRQLPPDPPTGSPSRVASSIRTVPMGVTPEAKLVDTTQSPLPPMPKRPTYPMRLIRGGVFTMGSPDQEEGRGDDERQHQVTVSSCFMMQTEVTQAQWKAVMGTSNPSYFKGDSRPVEGVTWCDTVNFANALSRKEGRQEAYGADCRNGIVARVTVADGYRLPTEAEWEYAARGGTTTRFHSGDSEDDLTKVAWYGEENAGSAHPVGEKEENRFGLKDMHGNVFEWCSDWYGAYSHGRIANPQSAAVSESRVFRGGTYWLPASSARAAERSAVNPGERSWDRGFRLVLPSPKTLTITL